MPNSRQQPDMAQAARLDTSSDGTSPTIVIQTQDGTWHYYPLSPPVAAAIIKKLAGALVHPLRHHPTFKDIHDA